MQQFTREEHNLILPWNDRLIAAFADVGSVFQSRVVNSQLPAGELHWLAMKEVHEREVPRRNPITAVVAVESEEVSVIAGRDLYFHVSDGKILHTQLL